MLHVKPLVSNWEPQKLSASVYMKLIYEYCVTDFFFIIHNSKDVGIMKCSFFGRAEKKCQSVGRNMAPKKITEFWQNAVIIQEPM